jgi:hypothetical protein
VLNDAEQKESCQRKPAPALKIREVEADADGWMLPFAGV